MTTGTSSSLSSEGSVTQPSSTDPSSSTSGTLDGVVLSGNMSSPTTGKAGVTPTNSSVLGTYPHLAHYIFNLLSSVAPSPPRSSHAGNHHPLSISSSGESDEEDETNGKDTGDEDHTAVLGEAGHEQKTPRKSNGDASGPDKEALVMQIVERLDNDEEDEVKELLKVHMGDLGKVSCPGRSSDTSANGFQDEILMDQVCLDCMHRRRGEYFTLAKIVTHSGESLTPAS